MLNAVAGKTREFGSSAPAMEGKGMPATTFAHDTAFDDLDYEDRFVPVALMLCPLSSSGNPADETTDTASAAG